MNRSTFIILLRYWPILAVLLGMYWLGSGWAAIFVYHAGIIAGLVASRTPWRNIREGFKPLPAIGFWLTGLLAAPIVVLLLPLLVGLDSNEVKTALRGGLERAGVAEMYFWLFVVYLCLPHPVIEELGWRELQFVDSPGLHLRDFEFASYHLLVMHYFFPWNWPFFIGCLVSLAVMGWFWRQLKIKFNGLAVPIWSHAGGDLGVMLGIFWLIC